MLKKKFKRFKTSIKKFLYSRKVEKKIELRVKGAFRSFFEGIWIPDMYDQAPVITVPIKNFEITDLKVFRYRQMLVFQISLGRPGILIGKGGRTIDAVTKHLNECLGEPVKIVINESNIWR